MLFSAEESEQRPSRIADDQIHDRDTDKTEKGVKRARGDDAGGAGQIHNGEITDDGGLLQRGDKLVFEKRQRGSQRLRENHVEEGLSFAQSERSGGFDLSDGHGLYRRIEYFRKECRGLDCQSDNDGDNDIQSAAAEDDIDEDHQQHHGWDLDKEAADGIHDSPYRLAFGPLQRAQTERQQNSEKKAAERQYHRCFEALDEVQVSVVKNERHIEFFKHKRHSPYHNSS